jgi:RNA polymerase sigma-70 factor (ECF subfamily)
MNSKTQATLLARLRDGTDPLAWDEFFERYGRLLFVCARHRGCSEHTAEEIVQEVMLAVFQKRDVYRYDPSRGRFRDWLGGVVRNKVKEHRRRPSERVRARGGDADGDLVETEAADADAEAAWEAAFEEALLGALLDVVRREVSPRAFQAFELFTLHDLPGAKVAQITGLSRNAVYLARRKVFRRLSQLGGKYGRDGRLDDRVKRALRARPSAAAERSLISRIEQTMQSRWED